MVWIIWLRHTKACTRSKLIHSPASVREVLCFAYAALLTAAGISAAASFARSSEAMQIMKQATLISKRLRFDMLIARNSERAMLNCIRPPHSSAIQPM